MLVLAGYAFSRPATFLQEELSAGLSWAPESSWLNAPYGLLSSSSHISLSVPTKAALENQVLTPSLMVSLAERDYSTGGGVRCDLDYMRQAGD